MYTPFLETRSIQMYHLFLLSNIGSPGCLSRAKSTNSDAFPVCPALVAPSEKPSGWCWLGNARWCLSWRLKKPSWGVDVVLFAGSFWSKSRCWWCFGGMVSAVGPNGFRDGEVNQVVKLVQMTRCRRKKEPLPPQRAIRRKTSPGPYSETVWVQQKKML